MSVRYYYLDPDGETVRGPLIAADLRSEWTRRSLPETTPCTREGEENWQPVGSLVDELYSAAPAPAGSVAPAVAAPMPVAGKVVFGCAGIILAGLLLLLAGAFVNARHPEIARSGDDGYNRGYVAGKEWAERGHSVPTKNELHSSTLRVARNTVHPEDEGTWVDNYEIGFEAGFKETAKPAF